jgi:hypothetical protein
MAYAISLNDAFYLGVLCSRVHLLWALRGGGRVGVGNDPRYISDSVFLTFPFPDCSETQKQTIRETAERLDAHRKNQQRLYPDLTITDMYNVLEKLRAGTEFTEKDRVAYEEGLVGILRKLHDELDHAVLSAYGWATDLSIEQVLDHIVALNAQRHIEEESGIVRWLRPEFQARMLLLFKRLLAAYFLPRRSQRFVASRCGPPPSQIRSALLRMLFVPILFKLHSRSLQVSSQQVAPELQRYLKRSQLLGRPRKVEGKYSL